jgi:hypothetical protein
MFLLAGVDILVFKFTSYTFQILYTTPFRQTFIANLDSYVTYEGVNLVLKKRVFIYL